METRFPSGKEFPYLLASIRGEDRVADSFGASVVVVPSPLVADSFGAPVAVAPVRPAVAPPSVATDVAPVVYDIVVLEPPPTVQAFALHIYRVQRNTESTSYYDTIARLNAKKWLKAMHTELQALEDNCT